VKILVVTTSYPRHPDDAAGSFVATRVAALLAAGHEVEVLAAGDPAATGLVAPRLTVTRIDHEIVGAPAQTPSLFYGSGAPERFDADPGAAWLGGIAFVARLLSALRPRLGIPGTHVFDAIETHWLVPSALAVVALGHRGAHRAHAHSGDVALLEALPAGATLAARLVGAGTTLVFASEDLRARFARLVARAAGATTAAQVMAADVVPADSGLCLAPPLRLGPSERQQRNRRDGIAGAVMLGVGRLVPIKGYDRLIRAVARLGPPGDIEDGPPTVVILGEGPERARLAALAAARGIDLRLPGQVSPAVVADWLTRAALFVHPCRQLPGGRTEGLPVAVREALLARVPVVATRSGGLGELALPWAGQLRLIDDASSGAGDGATVYLDALANALRTEPV
jgi:glycosyltransferase involved in cell wall biosynthesis